MPDLFLRGVTAGHEDRKGGRLGAFDAFDVVVRHRGAALSLAQDIVHTRERQTHGRHTHRGTVAPTVVGARLGTEEPLVESAAIASIRVPTSKVAVGGLVGGAVQNRVLRRDREDRVIGEAAARVEERKVGSFVRLRS